MPGPRAIAIFASSRADLWPLAPVITRLCDEPAAAPYVIAAGTRHAAGFETALAELELDVGAVELVEGGSRADDVASLAGGIGRLTEGSARVMAERRPDLLVALGDRVELLGLMAAATLHRVPVAHLHGGEITTGAIDDAVRHAVTKLSHIHCCATQLAAGRVLAMGEEPWRVHVTGAPGIDRLAADATHWSARDLEARIGFPIERPFGLLCYHPPTAWPELADRELEAVLDGVSALRTVVATAPGAEPGSARILDRLRSWAGSRSGAVVLPSLGELYPAAMAAADVIVGNSSSGIIEAPTLGTPSVNVGARQDGRERARSVVDTPGATARDVAAGVARALDPAFRAESAGVVNPYGDGEASRRIVEILLDQPLEPLLHKRFCGPNAP